MKNAIKFKLLKTDEDKKALKEAIELKNAIEYRERIKEVTLLGVAWYLTPYREFNSLLKIRRILK